MPARNLGERKSMTADSDVGFDGQGYLLTHGDDGDDTVKKTGSATDSVVGVNYISTQNADDTEVLQGIEVAVIHDGYPMVLCAEGYDYTSGAPVYVSNPSNADGYEGVATADNDPDGSAGTVPTKVGNVVPGASKNLSDADGPELVQVDVTNNLGDPLVEPSA